MDILIQPFYEGLAPRTVFAGFAEAFKQIPNISLPNCHVFKYSWSPIDSF